MFKKLKENKKGFTLVELIVVLVILAILAALLVPALTGYIDRAKKKSVIAETRQAVMAAQTLVDEAYAKQDAGADAIVIAATKGTDTAKAYILTSDIATLAELTSTNIVSATVETGVVKTLVYKNKGKWCTYTQGASNGSDGAYNVTDSAPTTTTP